MIKKVRMIAGCIFFIVAVLCFVFALNGMRDALALREEQSLAGLGLIAIIPLVMLALIGQVVSSLVTVVCVAGYVRCGVKGYAVAAVVIIVLTCVMLVVSAIFFVPLLIGNGTPASTTA